jgi:hypothetical protein
VDPEIIAFAIEKNQICFDKKVAYRYLPYIIEPYEGLQSFQLSRKNSQASALQNMKFTFFSFLRADFPGPRSGSNDPSESRSNPDKDLQHGRGISAPFSTLPIRVSTPDPDLIRSADPDPAGQIVP